MNLEGQKIAIGKLLRADNSHFVAGCRVRELETPALGSLCKVDLGENLEVYGLITNIIINDDGLVRQMVSGVSIPSEYTADNRYNRNLPVEIHVLTVGYQSEGAIHHYLPPRPPLSLDVLYLCDDAQLVDFIAHGRFGYFRHILRMMDSPVEELLVCHLGQARAAHEAAGDTAWYPAACKELITLLRDDYVKLASVLNALAELE